MNSQLFSSKVLTAALVGIGITSVAAVSRAQSEPACINNPNNIAPPGLGVGWSWTPSVDSYTSGHIAGSPTPCSAAYNLQVPDLQIPVPPGDIPGGISVSYDGPLDTPEECNGATLAVTVWVWDTAGDFLGGWADIIVASVTGDPSVLWFCSFGNNALDPSITIPVAPTQSGAVVTNGYTYQFAFYAQNSAGQLQSATIGSYPSSALIDPPPVKYPAQLHLGGWG